MRSCIYLSVRLSRQFSNHQLNYSATQITSNEMNLCQLWAQEFLNPTAHLLTSKQRHVRFNSQNCLAALK